MKNIATKIESKEQIKEIVRAAMDSPEITSVAEINFEDNIAEIKDIKEKLNQY